MVYYTIHTGRPKCAQQHPAMMIINIYNIKYIRIFARLSAACALAREEESSSGSLLRAAAAAAAVRFFHLLAPAGARCTQNTHTTRCPSLGLARPSLKARACVLCTCVLQSRDI